MGKEEAVCEDWNWIELNQEALVLAVLKLQIS